MIMAKRQRMNDVNVLHLDSKAHVQHCSSLERPALVGVAVGDLVGAAVGTLVGAVVVA